jgi:DNA-binding CsgD family transcriptional regulator
MLTPRQREVAERVARGMPYKAIARDLGIALDTVDRHVRDAAARIPSPGTPRHRCVVWFFNLDAQPEQDAA